MYLSLLREKSGAEILQNKWGYKSNFRKVLNNIQCHYLNDIKTVHNLFVTETISNLVSV